MAAIIFLSILLSIFLQQERAKGDNPILAVFPPTASKSDEILFGGNCTLGRIKRLNHLQIDRSNGKIYIGSVNHIIQLDLSLKIEACVVTGPKNDSPQCHASGCNSPEIETWPTDNINKILILDQESQSLIVCGSLFQGACEKYQLSNISGTRSQFIPISMAANDENSSTYAFIGPEHYNQWGKSNVLYVGTTFTNNGEYRHDVPAISSRNLHTLEIAEYSFSKQSLLRIDVKYRDHFLVKYVYGFNYSDYAYFVIVQKQSYLPGQEEMGYVTRLARVCINDANYDSYTEVTLQCLVKDATTNGGKGAATILNYNLIQDAKLAPASEELAISLGIETGEAVLFTTFSPNRGITNEPQAKSAICVYSMRDIEATFTENIHMCFNGSIKYRNMLYISGSISNGDCQSSLGGAGNHQSNFCEIALRISGVIPISAESAVHIPDALVTSITVAATEKSTVCFVGTSKGFLKKVLLLSSNNSIVYESLSIDPDNQILPDTTVSLFGDHVYVLSESKVVKLSVENCGNYTNCSACLDVKDPYCGWCSLERKCTRRSACQKASQSSPRWLSFGTGQQCIDFEQVLPDRIPINQMATVQLTIRTLPELPYGAKYRCVFGGADPIDAGVTSYGLICLTPAVKFRPKIPDGKDHIYVPLSVRSSETNKDFVSRNFAYFDCNAHKKCGDCVMSHWACNWCVYENKCTHNASICRQGISGENNPTHSSLLLHGRNSCPRFIKPTNDEHTILIPNGVSKEIRIEVENLPHPMSEHSGFLCIIILEDAKMMVPALVEQERFVTCDKTPISYVANKGEYEAQVSVIWNRNHYIDTMNVTLYKCNILGSHRDHADCSLCITRNTKYNCAWCNNVCTYSDLCQQPVTDECPKPRIDMIKPLSGPVEGGTLVTIEGSNLGLKEDDVKNRIHIGGTPCTLVEYQVSVRIVCQTGYSSIKKVATVVIGNAVGFTESSVHFSYENITLTMITPTVGPISGGTQLAIAGTHLNIGSHTTAFLDSLPCAVNSTQATSTRITCVTAKVLSNRSINTFTLTIDGANRTLTENPFTYKPDPTIAEIKPLMSPISGGRMITVHGTYFDTIQKPEMVIFSSSQDFHMPINKTDCAVLSPMQMECPSPAINDHFQKFLLAMKNHHHQRRKRTGDEDGEMQMLSLKLGFVMDNVESVTDLEKHYPDLPSSMTYRTDPKYGRFPNEIKLYKGDTLVIEGENLNLASDESDAVVLIGTVPCNVTSLASTQLVCTPPLVQPTRTDDNGKNTWNGLPSVVVRVGKNLHFPIGYIQYDTSTSQGGYSFPSEAIIGIIILIIILLVFFMASLTFFRRKSTQAEREYKRIQIQMDTLESNVRMECKQAFAELQTDMTDLTADLSSSGIPTLDHNEYIMKVFFPGVRDHPCVNDPKVRIFLSFAQNYTDSRYHGFDAEQIRLHIPLSAYDRAMLEFGRLLEKKEFVLVFVEALECQNTFDIRDRVNVASLLMIILMGKMEYATVILRCLLWRLMEKSISSKNPHLMLRKTESVVEKMLTNWLSLCMYGYMKEYAGNSLFLLYKAIKHQVEKGPVDAVTHEARYSLSEEKLLREQIKYNTVTLQVFPTESEDEKVYCKALDCDTISQVKSKIIDSAYKNTPFSLRPSIHDVDLEWRRYGCGGGPDMILRDEDITTKTVGGWRKLNTLAHYGIKDEIVVGFVPMSSSPEHFSPPVSACFSKSMTTTTMNPHHPHHHYPSSIPTATLRTNPSPHYYHLVKSFNERRGIHKGIPEIFLTRLLSTKGTIQKFVDDFFNTILSIHELPIGVKWLFDLFDEAAVAHNISDPELVYAWKSNSLPLRFWVNLIKNPDFIFDINKTPTIDSCLSVIAQTFMDSCSMSDHVLGKDSPSNKLLFAKDIPQYREIVGKFYNDIRALPQITEEQLSIAMKQLSIAQREYFHTASALKELYIYATKYQDEILRLINLNPHFKSMKLDRDLLHVSRTLECDLEPYRLQLISGFI